MKNPTVKEYIDKNGLNLTDGLVKVIEAIYDEQQDELERQNNVSILTALAQNFWALTSLHSFLVYHES